MDKNKKIKILYPVFAGIIVVSLLAAHFFIYQNRALAQENNATTEKTEEFSKEIEAKKQAIEKLQKEIDAYASQIKTKQQEAKGLKNQLGILENQIAKTELDVQATEEMIQETNLEIQSLNLRIQQKEKEILQQKEKIIRYIQLVNKNDQTSYLEVTLLYDNFSDFFDYIKSVQVIHNDLKGSFDQLKAYKDELGVQKNNLEDRKKTEEDLKNQLSQKRSDLSEKSTAKQIVLVQTKLTEKQYQNSLYQLQLEQQQINSEIMSLEKKVREELSKQKEEQLAKLGPARLAWPVSPSRGITTYFHDPDYPFRYIFEHPAIDIRASQGTPLKAAEAGYIGKVQFAGNTSYGYILIIHGDNLSTVYGHVSAVRVAAGDYVIKGQIIGSSGGTPGTKGAGNLTTGPHLHFEVRLNGIPVDPIQYLPSY